MSLRQVLAASLADAAPPEPERREEVRVVHVDRERERLSEVSDLDLDLGDDDESDDEGMMKHEERAMREEFEKRGESSMSSSESSDSSEDEAAGRKKPRVGSFGEPVDWGTVQDEMVDPEAEKEQMFGGGRGVVTWSDYDDDDEEEGNGDETEDDAELDGLLLQHANSKRDRQAEEAELEALWLEEEQENEGDDESSDGEETEDDDEEQTLVFMDGWEAFARGGGAVINGSESEMDDDETDFSEEEIDAGDTTDSLDSDDHVNLVRFGIEDDEEDSDSEDDDDFGRGMVSLADVQAPTTADLASLPQHFLFSSKRGVSVMVRVEEDGVEEDEVALREAMFRKAKKGKGRAYELAEIVEESDRDTEREGKARGNPAMGMFDRKFRGKKELCVVIDESDAVAPSPFSKMKRKKRRHMLTGSPPRRTRSDSKVSTTTATSVTDGSISGEILDVASPFLPQLEPEGWDFALNDVLDASLLNNGSSASDSSESDVETTIRLAGSTSSSARKPSTPGISDLSRWSRIPIGAFRSSTVSSSFSPSAHYFAAVEDDPTSRSSPGNSIFLPLSNKSILRSAQGASSLSHTLSSPRGMSTTQRAIERMLTSPVFGPISSPVPQFSVDGPKSRKDRRKEKKAKSSTSIAMTSPKKEVVASTSK
ncbi:hypothetical protein MNV49_004375 [Pseudohyphozyma bogoriensis]|nr:hypothetical protein MNV49_004375 [Pseudohyphozyma bogoriensis]